MSVRVFVERYKCVAAAAGAVSATVAAQHSSARHASHRATRGHWYRSHKQTHTFCVLLLPILLHRKLTLVASTTERAAASQQRVNELRSALTAAATAASNDGGGIGGGGGGGESKEYTAAVAQLAVQNLT